MPDPAWPGEVVRDALGLVLGPDEGAVPVEDVVGLALRRNPRRAHLPVSRVLGKHLPTEPRRMRAAADDLADTIRRCLAETATPAGGAPVVLGYAENATALAHLVADGLDADHVVHTTRRVVAGASVLVALDEQHSHAPRHVLVPDDPGRWTPDRPLVLVDDELTTGRTAATTLRALHRLLPRRRYLVATLADLRAHSDDAVERVAHDLGVRVDVVASARSRLDLPADVLDRAAHLLRTWEDGTVRPEGRAETVTVHLPLDGAAEGARHGLDRDGRAALERAIPGAAASLADALGPRPGRVLVLGCEELHYLPLRLAETLAAGGADVHLAATTRSPLVARDVAGYPVRSGLAFAAHDVALGHAPERYVYGLGAPGRGHYDTVVLVVDAAARTPVLRRPDGLLSRLGAVTTRIVEAVVPCRGPGSGGPPVRTRQPPRAAARSSARSPATRWAGCSATCRRSPSRRRRPSGRRRSAAAGSTTRRACRRSPCPPRRTSGWSPGRSSGPPRRWPRPSVSSPTACSRCAGGARCWCRWRGRARRSGCWCAGGPRGSGASCCRTTR